MNNYEEIKQVLAEGNLKQAMLIALSNSLKLKLKTIVKEQDIEPKTIETTFNLIQGIETRIESKVLESNYQHITDFHQQQLHSAYETWEKNRATLVKIFQLLSGKLVNLGEGKNNLQAETEENYVDEILSSFTENASDNLAQFSLESVTQETEEKVMSDDDYSVEEAERQAEDEISYEQESSAIFEPEIPENWVDEINESEEITESPVSGNLPENSQFQDSSIVEKDLTDLEEKEEIIEEEIEIEETQPEESWDDLDWGENQESEANQEIVEIREKTISQESSSTVEANDDWQEWLDNDNLSREKEDYDVEKIDWNQEDWQGDKN